MKYVIARGEDWEGIYIDGQLIIEGHTIELEKALKLAIEKPPTEITTKWVDLDWIYDHGYLPTDMYFVKWQDD
jgi:hypothetical protein